MILKNLVCNRLNYFIGLPPDSNRYNLIRLTEDTIHCELNVTDSKSAFEAENSQCDFLKVEDL
jgi:hypothetical protein